MKLKVFVNQINSVLSIKEVMRTFNIRESSTVYMAINSGTVIARKLDDPEGTNKHGYWIISKESAYRKWGYRLK